MLAKRIIPCLDVDDGRVKKGVNFVNLVDVGSPVDIAASYEQQQADELVFLDITATVDVRTTMRDVVQEISSQVFMPLTVGGGIKSVDNMTALLKAGADKVSLNRKRTEWKALDWAKEAVSRGAGELLVTSMDKDGTKSGFDIELYKAIEAFVDVPIIASGGAGKVQDFIDLFEQTGVTGALAASIHFGEIKIPDLKNELRARGITVR